MSHTSLHSLLLTVLLVSSTARAQFCPISSAEELFDISPSDHIVEPGDTITFMCSLKPELSHLGVIQWEYLLFNRTIPSTVNPSQPDTMTLGYELDMSNQLTIPDIQPIHAGKYSCLVSSNFCPELDLRKNAFLRVMGPPEILLHNDTYLRDTVQDLTVEGIIRGFPSPRVLLMREVNDEFRPLVDPRFEITFDNISATVSITIRGVRKADGGRYRVDAINSQGTDNETFTLIPRGPDPPVATSVEAVVSGFEDDVRIMCRIQPDGYEVGETTFEWTDPQGNVVVSDNSIEVSDLMNGMSTLTIRDLQEDQLGLYTCTAMNVRDSDSTTTRVTGPPPAPEDPTIRPPKNVTWNRPNFEIPITGYVITVYESTTDVEVVEREMIEASADDTMFHHVITGVEKPGIYEVTVASRVDDFVGPESGRSTFTITESDAFPLLPVVLGAVGGVVFVVLVLAIISICFCCYCSRSKNNNSHQQRWGSEEDKVGSRQQQQQQPAVSNTYTALSLHNSSELPPSPLSPMPSSVGIDPKWEFPRENIKPLDVLAEGQFTVLYKGIAKNLAEKPCEVAIKALKDDATEDDLKALVYEIDVLSSIEEHPNIVSLVRVCSVGKPLYMVMEYMCHGDLLGFLRACRGHHGMYTVSPGNRYQPPSLQLCSRDLLNMATKIANGMRYLADRKIVHRALCTRNILVGSGMDVKIYNVGSFDVTFDNREDSLVKWMAPETLFDGTNTTYSDVWSFGVTLWELVTVGGTPYGEILPEDLYAQLQGGMRMPCPSHCAQEVYDIMSACWQKNPTDRPHFAIIHENLDELVMSKLNYLDLRSYDGYAYSQFGDDVPQLSTAL